MTYFPAASMFILHALTSGGTVLVHGNSGISRSPSFVIAYLMECYGMGFAQSYTHVQNMRFCINPNPGFRQQLRVINDVFACLME